MSKRKVEIEIDGCDFCDSNQDTYHKCLRCKKDICYECETKHAVKYNHSIYCSGSGDGLYCHECDKLAAGSMLHDAYMKIRSLSSENKGWYEDFTKRAEAAEAELKALLDGMKEE